jgi:hypothetical protein
MVPLLAHQCGFQIVWFTCALSGASGRTWPGVLAAATFIGLALRRPEGRRSTLALVALAIAAGLGVDLLLVGSGRVAYASTDPRIAASPLWILALWAAFAPTIPVAFGWLRGRVGLAVLVGAAGGCAATAAGGRLGALRVLEPLGAGWWPIAVAWGVAFPVLVVAAGWLAGSRDPKLDRLRVDRGVSRGAHA